MSVSICTLISHNVYTVQVLKNNCDPLGYGNEPGRRPDSFRLGPLGIMFDLRHCFNA